MDINTWVIMRSLLSSDLNTLLFFILVTIFALSYTLLLVERPHIAASGDLGHGLDEFETCVWVTIITLTTVGLGDVVPATKLGRVAVVINSCAGIAFYALVVNIIVANVSLSPQETRIVEFVKRVGLTKTCKASAAKVIQTCWRQYRINVSLNLHATTHIHSLQPRVSCSKAAAATGTKIRHALIPDRPSVVCTP